MSACEQNDCQVDQLLISHDRRHHTDMSYQNRERRSWRNDEQASALPEDWDSPEQLDEIIDRLKAGVPILTIARDLDWDDHTLARAMRRYGRLVWLDNEEIEQLERWRLGGDAA